MDHRRQRLDELAERWRARHDARRDAAGAQRPAADAERQLRARAAFPYREQSPGDYADLHAGNMIGFTYDEYAYDDAELDAWLVELGAILRRRREMSG